MSKHTPGPWAAIPDSGEDSEGDWYIIAPDEDVITTGLSEPDAALIAAAPDLLAALKALSAGLHDEIDMKAHIKASEVRAARAAIAKAEGTS